MAMSDNLWSTIVNNTTQNLPQEIVTSLESNLEAGPGSGIDANTIKGAMSQVGGAEQDMLIQLYLALNYANKIDNFDECLKTLTRIFSECGLDEGDNPYITYLNLDGSKYAKPLTAKSLLLLNNLYADNYIEAKDIQGRSDMRTNHPIFKQKFFELEDPEFTIQSFNWLSNLNKLKQLNYGALANWHKLGVNDVLKTLSETISTKQNVGIKNSKEIYVTDQGKLNDIDVLTFRTAFVNGGYGETSYDEFRPTNELKEILNMASKDTKASTMDKVKKDEEPSNIKKTNENDLDELKLSISKSMSNLSNEQKLSLLKGIISDYKFNKYDIFDY